MVKIKDNNKYCVSKKTDGNYTIEIYTKKQFIASLFGEMSGVDNPCIALCIDVSKGFLEALSRKVDYVAATGKKKIVGFFSGAEEIRCFSMKKQGDGSYVYGDLLSKPVSLYLSSSVSVDGENIAMSVEARSQSIKMNIPVSKFDLLPASKRQVAVMPSTIETGVQADISKVMKRLVEAYVSSAPREEAELIYELNMAIQSGSAHASKILKSGKINPDSCCFSNQVGEGFCNPLWLIGRLAAEKKSDGSADQKLPSHDYLANVAIDAIENGFTYCVTEVAALDAKFLDRVIGLAKSTPDAKDESFYVRAMGYRRDFGYNIDNKGLFERFDCLKNNGVDPDYSSIRYLARSCYSIQDEDAAAILEQLIAIGGLAPASSDWIRLRRPIASHFMEDSKPLCASLIIERTKEFDPGDEALARQSGFHNVMAAIESIKLERSCARNDEYAAENLIRRAQKAL